MEIEDKRKEAKKRVDELKGFYIHLAVYIAVNIFIQLAIVINHYKDGEPLFSWPSLVTPFFWGIGLAFHAAHVFGFGLVLGKDWEERMIRKYMEEDRREAEKFKDKN
ncbi:MAG: 2TM domain-containing protein [Robiginitalea sp.]|jgi:hypothetical protein